MYKKKKLYSAAIIGCVCFFIATSQASAFVLDFEGLRDHEGIDEFYNGGAGSLGSSYGTDIDVSFSSNASAIIDSDAGGTGEFANEPSADTVVHWHSGSDIIMNVLSGFDTGFSFFYSSGASAIVNVYGELNGQGNLLASLNLVAQGNDNCVGDPNGDFCNWTNVGLSFTGTAYSVSFGGTADLIGYDDITIGSSAVPEPATFALIVLGLAGLSFTRRRT